jgi:hypothetical protein
MHTLMFASRHRIYMYVLLTICAAAGTHPVLIEQSEDFITLAARDAVVRGRRRQSAAALART